ncbi:uncharacterized protein LOC123563150 [Mercenaria mercenaria]|uniref:uncharacterized protein LOC123563150 n=1 Tax=Mercenaria mercenaria TaxID=6596 RepID=UPI00234F53B4|nr:uncharacterized protein LOC123563150 [Mercenaria mercenaria]
MQYYYMNTSAIMNSVLYAAIISVLPGSVSCDEGHKRLLLHDDASLSQAYQTLAAEVKEMKSTITTLTSTVANLQSSSGSGGGSVYFRWGRTSCPANGTYLIYSGHAAGVHYGSKGGATNHLCLPTDPQWAHYEDAVKSGGKIYGVEYQFWDYHSNGGSAFLAVKI